MPRPIHLYGVTNPHNTFYNYKDFSSRSELISMKVIHKANIYSSFYLVYHNGMSRYISRTVGASTILNTLFSPMQSTAAHETLLTLPFRQRAQQQLPFFDTTAERAADVQPYLSYWQ